MLLPPVKREDVDERYHKLIFDGALKHEDGKDASQRKMMQAWGHSPEPLLHVGRLGLYLRWHSKLDPRLRQMAMLATMQAMQCDYATIHHCRMSMDLFNCSEDDVRFALGQGDARPGTVEEKVVTLAKLSATTGNAPKWLVGELHKALGHQNFLDLAHSIGIYQHICTVLNLVDIGPPESEAHVMQAAKMFGFTTEFE